MQIKRYILSRVAVVSALAAVTMLPAFSESVLSTQTSAPTLGNAVAKAGTPITVSASVKTSQGALVKVGTINFCIQSSVNPNLLRTPCGPFPLATAQITAAGVAVSSIRLPIGTQKIVAVYAGTHTLKGSVSPSAVATVSGEYKTATTLTYSGKATDLILTAAVHTAAAFIPGELAVGDVTDAKLLLSAAGPVTTTYSFPATGAELSQNAVAPYNVVTADLNNDGYPDVVSLGYSTSDNPPGRVRISLNKPGSGLQPLVPGPTAAAGESNGFNALGVGDFNNDDIPDLVLYNFDTSTLEIFYGKGDGTFPAKPSVSIPVQGSGPSTSSIFVSDFNEDGSLDFAYTSSDGGGDIVVYPNNGDGTFGNPIVSSSGGGNGGPLGNGLLFTQNKSGHANLAFPTSEPSAVLIFEGQGDGTFDLNILYTSSNFPNPAYITALDLNGDGYQDLVVGATGNAPAVILSTGVATITGAYTIGKSPTVAETATDVLALPEGVLCTDQFGHFTLLQPGPAGKYPQTNFTFVSKDSGSNGGAPEQQLLAPGDFTASGLTGFLLANNGESGMFSGFYQDLQAFTASASSTMTVSRSGFSYPEPQTLLGLYYAQGNPAFLPSISNEVTVPGTK